MSLRHYIFDESPHKPDEEPSAVGSYSSAPLDSTFPFPPLFTPQLIVHDSTLSDLQFQGLVDYAEEARATRGLDIDAEAPSNVRNAFGALHFLTEQLGERENGTSSKSDHSVNIEVAALAGYSIAAALDPSLPPNSHRSPLN